MNGASDALLEELLATNKAQTEILLRMANKAGADTSGISDASKGLGIVGKAARDAGAVFGALVGTIKLFANGLSALSSTVTQTAGVIKQLGQSAMDGKASVTDVTSALSGLPGPLGKLAGAAGFAAQALEANMKAQQDLAKSGANFSGNLDLIRQSAAKSYLSLSEFSSVVSKNGEIFRTMGGDVQAGVNQFVKIQTALMDSKSPIAGNLATLGYSMEDAAHLTTSYMKMQGSMNKAGLQDTAKVTAAIQQYAQELDFMSKVTGKSREELQKKMEEENAEAQWQAMLATMSPEKADKMRQGMQNAMMQGGQGAVDAFKAQAQGLPPQTEAGQLYVATQRAGAQALKQYVDRANDATISVKQNAEMNRSTLAKQIADGAMDREKLQKVLQADAAAGGSLSKSFADATKLQTAFMQGGKMMSEKEIAAKLESMAKEGERSKSQAEAAQKTQKAMMDLTNQILAKLLPIFNFFLDITMKVAKALGDMFTPIIDFGSRLIKAIFGEIDTKGIGETITKFTTTFSKLLGSIDVETIATPIRGFMSFIGNIFKQIDFEALGAKITPIFSKIGVIFGDIGTAFTKAFGEGDGIGKTLQRIFEKFIDAAGVIISAVGTVITKLLASPFMGTMKRIFDQLVHIIEAVIDGIKIVIDSPLGTFVIDQLVSIFNYLTNMVEAIINVVSGVVDVVIGIVKFISGDFKGGLTQLWTGLKNIIGGIVDGIGSIVLRIKDLFVGGLKLLWDAITGILMGIIDGIKSLGTGIKNFFTGGGKEKPAEIEKKAESAAPSPATGTVPASSNASQPAANLPPVTAEAKKAAEEVDEKKRKEEKASALPPPPETSQSKDPIEILRAEIKTLNTQLEYMTRFMRDAADNTGKTASILASKGNLFK